VQRSLWIGGFAVGAILGTVILESGSVAPAAPTPTSLAARILEPAKAQPAQPSPSQQPPPQPSAFLQLEKQVAASQGGRISVGQIIAIARATSSQPEPPTFEQLAAQVSAMQGGRISIAEMLALRGAIIPQSSSYGLAPVYAPPVSQGTSAGLAQPYYEGSTSYQGVRGPSPLAADSAFESRAPSAIPPAEAAASNSPIYSFPNSRGLIDTGSGQYMAPAAGGYTDPRNGTFYAQSGPNGVVDTRTGEFIPTH
jgi:hypothetical protein